MNFGNLYPGTTSGTVVLGVTGFSYTRTSTGGVVLSSQGGFSPALFTLNAKKSWKLTASHLPTSVTLTRVGGTQTMTVTTFTSEPSPSNGWHSLTGTQVLPVGATLNVGANQAPGVYVSLTPFTVTVDFN